MPLIERNLLTKGEKMQKLPIKKKDLTVVESLIENSSEIVRLRNSVQAISWAIFEDSKCRSKSIDSSNNALKSFLKERRARITELAIHNANMFKAAYSHQYKITFTELAFSTAEMQAGYVIMYVGDKKERRKVVLFLSTVAPAFLDMIEEGTIMDYTEEIEEKYLSFCRPVWKPSSLRDLYIEHLKILTR